MQESHHFIIRDYAIKQRCLGRVHLIEPNSENIVHVIIQPWKEKRSLAQNNLYQHWAREYSDYTGISMEDIKDEWRSKYLSFKEKTVCYKSKPSFEKAKNKLGMIDGLNADEKETIKLEIARLLERAKTENEEDYTRVISSPISTTELSVKKFAWYLEQIELDCGVKGIPLTHPFEYQLAMGKN